MSGTPPSQISVQRLCLAYSDFAEGYYVKQGKPTAEVDCVNYALRCLIKLFGTSPAAEFGPKSLKLVRDEFIRDGQTRGTVSEEAIQAVLPHLCPAVQAMVQIQRLTGCRPGEICCLRPCDVDQTSDVWCFIPASHKTDHHGQERRIFIGPRAQAILTPWLARDPNYFCFSPKEMVDEIRRLKHSKRVTPLRVGNRPGTNRKKSPRRTPGDHYTSCSYRRAISRACQDAKIEIWGPNRLRHTRATELRRLHGLDAAQVVLGHTEAFVTQIYAGRDFRKAEEIMRLVG